MTAPRPGSDGCGVAVTAPRAARPSRDGRPRCARPSRSRRGIDHDDVARADDGDIAHAGDHDEAAGVVVDEAVLRPFEERGVSAGHVAARIGRAVARDRFEGPDVVPTERGFDHEPIGRLLEDAVIDRDLRQSRPRPFDARGVARVGDVVEALGEFRKMLTHGLQNAARGEGEDAAVPKEVAGLKKTAGFLDVGLLAERGDVEADRSAIIHALAEFDIAEARRRTGGTLADRDERIVSVGEFGRAQQRLAERRPRVR
jgi:hypothetical protein